jgi:hypothetical protein
VQLSKVAFVSQQLSFEPEQISTSPGPIAAMA